MLVVFGGLPRTGKTTIARQIAARQSATYVCIDEIEQAIRTAGVLTRGIGPTGYFVAKALSASNLADGLTPVADCTNPLRRVVRDGRRYRTAACHAETANTSTGHIGICACRQQRAPQ